MKSSEDRFSVPACADRLRSLYSTLNHREFVHPDPLEFLYSYEDVRDREIAGLIASGLAYGNVKQILKSVSLVLGRMGRPAEFLLESGREALDKEFHDFKHRFTTGSELAALLFAAKRIQEDHGSLEACFLTGMHDEDRTVIPALTRFVEGLRAAGRLVVPGSLIPSPEKGSACKRLNLFLRWMVRRDGVDPGGWDRVPCSKLIVPLDVHMHRLGLMLGFTYRKAANLKTAFEITDAFRKIDPEDPVRFDFCLTRLGIKPEILETDDKCALLEMVRG
ncbi:MAG: TIGR02757 family protein [Pseudomonadota bacterium]